MIDQIDNILFYLRNSDSKKPMKAETLAAKLQLSMERFEEIMNVICNIVPAPVNRAYKKVAENVKEQIPAFEGYVYWPTGVVEKAKRQHIVLSQPKPANQTQAYLESVKKVSADTYETYETPVFGQTPAVDTVVAEIEKVIDTPAAVTDAPASPDYSDKPKAYQMLKYIEAHPGCTNREIMLALNMDPYIAINAYIKPYSDFVRIDNPAQGPRVFTLTIPVDSFYVDKRKAVPKQPGAKNEATPIPQQPQETTATDTVDAQGHEAESSGFAADQASQTFTDSRENEIHQTQMEHDHPAVDEPARYRFAYTNDGCLMLMTFGQLPIELNRHETQLLISFLEDQLTLMRVA